MFSPTTLSLLPILFSLNVLADDTIPFSPCPLLGPRFPIPKSSNTPTMHSGLKNLTSAFDNYIRTANGTFGPITPNTTSFSITLFSTETSNTTDPFLWEYHYTAPTLKKVGAGAKSVGKDSVYRAGELSTLFTVWTFLIEAGEKYFDDAVCKHVPELAGLGQEDSEIWTARWDEITLGDLAANLGGIGMWEDECGVAAPLARLLGQEDDDSKCNRETTRSEFLERFAKHAPVFGAASTPIYSNAGYILLALALENITGTPFATLLKRSILDPLNLTSTSLLESRNSSNTVLPTNTSTTPLTAPYNGLTTSPSDLSLALRALLNSTLLPHPVTNRWLKPLAQTSNLVNTIGRPWEIYALTATPISPVIPVYQVRGNTGLFSSHIGLVPDYNVGFAILAADTEENPDLNAHADIIATEMIPTLEQNAIVQASLLFAGTYTAKNGTNTTLVIDPAADSSPGLALSSFVHGSTDVRAIYANLTDTSPRDLSFRLFPTDLVEKTGAGTYKQAFRALFQDMSELADAGTPTCETWRGVDGLQVGGRPLDLFVFEVGSGGKVEGVEVPGLKLRLGKE